MAIEITVFFFCTYMFCGILSGVNIVITNM